jgi:hypoxanthine phosphoribosyltransferase
MGDAITAHYPPGEKLLVLGLLKGSFIFLADLVRTIQLPLQVDFLVASSYGDDTLSSGDVRLLYDPDTSFEGRHVLIVEDIIDSGNTLRKLVPVLEGRGPGASRSAPFSTSACRKWNWKPAGSGSTAPTSSLWGTDSITRKTSGISPS